MVRDGYGKGDGRDASCVEETGLGRPTPQAAAWAPIRNLQGGSHSRYEPSPTHCYPEVTFTRPALPRERLLEHWARLPPCSVTLHAHILPLPLTYACGGQPRRHAGRMAAGLVALQGKDGRQPCIRHKQHTSRPLAAAGVGSRKSPLGRPGIGGPWATPPPPPALRGSARPSARAS